MPVGDPALPGLLATRLFGLSEGAERARFSPGYLYLPGLFRLTDILKGPRETRLLIENPIHNETLEQIAQRWHRLEPVFDAAEGRRHVSRPELRQIVTATADGFRRCLESMEQNETDRKAGLQVLELLERKQVHVRVHVHGTFGLRVYLFERMGSNDASASGGLIGGENLLLPGGLAPGECTLSILGRDACSEPRNWFDRLWDEAVDVSELLAAEIRRSWIALLATPYDVYMKTLYILVRDRVELDPIETFLDDDILSRLSDFQQAAFHQALRIIQAHGGVFVSDVVGLGKSFIGAAVIKHFERSEQARPIILCPAQLVDMWERYNEAHRLNAQVVSFGLLRFGDGGQNPLLDDYRYRDRDFVLIDESHALRNPGTQRYDLIREYVSRGRRRVCLLTATPRNRSAWDVYNQIKIFHQEDRTSLPIDPPNLREFFRAVDRGQQELPALLSHLLIRRTRSHVLRFYGYDAETNQRVDSDRFGPYRDGSRRAYVLVAGRKQFFPHRHLKTIEYSIEQTYQGLYDRIRHHLTPLAPGTQSDENRARLHLARYGLADYVLENRRTEEPYARLRTSSKGLHGLIRVLLFKRFESSVEAFRLSIRRMIEAHRRFLLALGQRIVPAGEEAQEALRQVGEAEEEELIESLREASQRYAFEDFDVERLTRDITEDLRLLENILTLVAPITPDQDHKLTVLKGLLNQPPMSEGKRLIFTQFADTARYLHEQLLPFGNPGARVGLMLSGAGEKGSVLGRFAPKANPEHRCKDPSEEIATLVTTDVMAEGLNLQDCDKIVNYDLHWNPVRLIQRFGRIDRIGSEYDRVFGFNFLPEAGLERNLGLRHVLRHRIREIHETIGEDSSILEADERVNEQAMYAIYEEVNTAFDALEDAPDERSVDLAEAEEMFRLLRENDPEEYARIAALPDGLRSARRSKSEGLFLFCQAGTYRELVLLDAAGNVLSRALPRLLGLLRCPRDTPTVEFPEDLTGVLLRAYQQFAQAARERRAELVHLPDLSQGQRYVLRELRAMFASSEDADLRAQAEQFEQVFRLPMPQAVIRQLNRLRRDGSSGNGLLRSLARIYREYGLRDRPRTQVLEAAEGLPRVLCSEGFVPAPLSQGS
jgi:superfamily II DNA or RNA helicase